MSQDHPYDSKNYKYYFSYWPILSVQDLFIKIYSNFQFYSRSVLNLFFKGIKPKHCSLNGINKF